MKTFAVKEKRSVSAIRRTQPSRFGYRGLEVKAQQAEIQGNWRLKVVDTYSRDIGMLKMWGIQYVYEYGRFKYSGFVLDMAS